MDIIRLLMDSESNREGNINSTAELLEWIKELNETTLVKIEEKSIFQDTFWFYDDYNGEILNRKRSFFSIKGMRRFENGAFISEQPIIIQPEIGYLGIICKVFDGVLNFLMQGKIEPGNINCVQISPTIQATKSNFTRAHGGNLPSYFELFEKSYEHIVLYDQIQSEQATRFYKKRNRNMIMLTKDDIDILPNYRWMTLGQIKELMKVDNLVNMDTRTVLSGIPFFYKSDKEKKDIVNNCDASILEESVNLEIPQLFQRINNYKMFSDIKMSTVPLFELIDWEIDEFGLTCKKQAPFMVRFYEIEIEGREVRKWSQPLFKAIGSATFGLITSVIDGKRKFLIRICPEFGSFDKVELGPTIQWEPTHYLYNDDMIEKVFRTHMERNQGIITKVMLSEEGGRFYHEQNLNVIIDVSSNEIEQIHDQYIWVSFRTLNLISQFNNILNIQLRNLLSLLDFSQGDYL